MPEGIRLVASLTPFAQALYIPISFLSGVQSPNQLGNAILTQVCSIIALGILSRMLFTKAARVLTVQGG